MTDPKSLLANIAMYGASPAITATLEAGRAAAKHTAPVLLIAEPGLEVMLLASQIHEMSRRTGPLRRIHGAEIAMPTVQTAPSASLLSGLLALPVILETVRSAKGGTLLIEDIDALTDSGQAIIESLLFEPVADATGHDVRVIASTSHDLHERVQRGQFRGVLLDRLLYAPIHIPPLRARDQDVLILAERILGTHRLLVGRRAPRISEQAQAALRSHPWPGNLPELERVLVRAALEATDGTIRSSQVVRAIEEPGEVFAALRPGGTSSCLSVAMEGVDLTATRPRTALSEALDRLHAKEDTATKDRAAGRALREALDKLHDHIILRELERVERLTLQQVRGLLKADSETSRRRLAALVRLGKIVQRQEDHKLVWSLKKPAVGAAESGPPPQV